MRSTSKKLKTLLTPEHIAVAVIILAGTILRLRQYLIGRSLWVDEAMLALNIVNRNFTGLFKPLDYDQGAPIGFLLIEKLINMFLGRNEYVLRLFPLILGLLSLWTFYLLLKRFVHGPGLVIALALFAFNPRLIYYSSEVKQYGTDVFVMILLLLVTIHFFENPSPKGLGFVTFAGFCALWLSHPSLFILAGIGITLLFSYLQKRDFTNLMLVMGMGAFWLVNVGLLYRLTLGDLKNNSYMIEYWQGAFAPMPLWSNLAWYWNTFQANANAHLTVTFAPWILLLFILTGWGIMFKQKQGPAIVIAWTMAFILLASSLKLYPSLERMVLFLIPIGILLIGITISFIHQKLRDYSIISVLTLTIICIYLFYGAMPLTMEQFIVPKYFEHIRPTMEYLQSAWKEGDQMYISNGGVPGFEYYAPIYGLDNVTYISGKRDDYENPLAMLEQIDSLHGQRRVWVLFSHVYEKGNFNEKDFLLEHLEENGDKLREFRKPGTSVFLYLFDLSQ